MSDKEYEICPRCDGCGKDAGPHGLIGRCPECKGTGQDRFHVDPIDDEETVEWEKASSRAEKAEAERDEWKAMADKEAQTLVEYVGIKEAAEDERDALLRSIESWKREELEWDAEREALRCKLETLRYMARATLEVIRQVDEDGELDYRFDGTLIDNLAAALAETKEENRTIEDRSSEISFTDEEEEE